MSVPVLIAEETLLGVEAPAAVTAATPAALPDAVKRHWIGGTSALAAAVVVERGTGLLANMLAARLCGAGVFGSYSLAISTANNIGTYAAGGIGATATRFSGKYSYESGSYGALARSLAIVALTSAALAAAALWAGAGPLAHLLHKPALTGLLRWAALSAAGMVLLECARGFFVGQRRIAALLLLSLLVGAGMLLMLPAAAHAHSPVRMVTLQAGVCAGAVVVCLVLAGPLALRGNGQRSTLRLLPMLKEIWSFGLVQLAGMIAANLAGWWLTTLIARADTTLAQVGFFAIASQMRNLAGLVPGLLTEGSYAVMAMPDLGGPADCGSAPHRVMALSSYASIAVAAGLAAVGIIAAPWLLHLLYGPAYVPASAALAMALALAVAHMGNAPAAARLSIVSIRTTGQINTLWAVFVAVAATLMLLHGGSAWLGLAILLAAHLLSASLVLLTLSRRDWLPEGMGTMYFVGVGGATLLAIMALWRTTAPLHAQTITVAMCGAALAHLLWLTKLGKRHRWAPSRAMLDGMRARIFARIGKQREGRHV